MIFYNAFLPKIGAVTVVVLTVNV